MQARERLILALDVPDADAAVAWVRRLGSKVGLVKIGLELFVAAGPELVRRVRGLGAGVFLDLKLHDIPNTVAGAVRSAARLDVQMLTLHASGGGAMLAAAVEAARASEHAPLLLGVTVLTSLEAAPGQVVALAQQVAEAGLGGAVASGQEAAAIRAAQPRLKLVVPGIRPAGASFGDQVRVATPAAAVRAGADYLVLGRAITAAADPEAALASVLAEITP